jgi:L-fuconolactonase
MGAAVVVGWTDLTRPDVADELARLATLPGGTYLRSRGDRRLAQVVEDEGEFEVPFGRADAGGQNPGRGPFAPWPHSPTRSASSPAWSPRRTAKRTLDDLRPYADAVLDAFGPDRLMFGSDWPVCTLAASYAQVIDTAHELIRDLDATGREAVLTGTATRVYRL